MPKALSLKKNIPKNQIAITQFFKNTQQVEKNTSLSIKEHSEKPTELKSTKRKVQSPTTCKENEIITEPDDVENGNISKKCKFVGNAEFSNVTVDKNKTENRNGTGFNASHKSPLKNGKSDQMKEVHCSNIKSENNNHNKNKMLDVINNFNGTSNKDTKNQSDCTNKENHVSQGDNIINNVDVKINSTKPKSPNKSLAVSTSKSPKKNGSCNESVNNYVENLYIDDHDIFEEEFDIDDMEENEIENLDLSRIQRCTILSIKQHPNKLELKLTNSKKERGTCFVEGVWLNTQLQEGEVVSVVASRDSQGCFTVGNSSGLLVLRPDHLISSTSVVAGVFCKRKAVLQERWRGIDSANTAMTIGTLVHELVQKALTQNITSLSDLRKEAEMIVKDSIQMLYDAGLSEQEAMSNMQMYLQPLVEFMQIYVVGNSKQNGKDQWNGRIDKVLDIEENLCCHELGLKGKIDATLQVTIHDRQGKRQEVVTLELKSGRASVSAEHRGQLVLYGMMLALQRDSRPDSDAHTGLLLYLKERVDLREVSCGYPERRDLIMLRNELAQHLAPPPVEADADQIADIEDAPQHFRQSLPEPVHSERACARCPYLTVCELHLWHADKSQVSEAHPLYKLRDEALGHLSPQHISYFLQWTSLLMMEERAQRSVNPLRALWTEAADTRSRKGVCAANLKLKSVTPAEGRHLHVFLRDQTASDATKGKSRVLKGPQEGEFCIVSVDARPWVAAGVVSTANEREIHIMLERDVSRRLENTLFHIDSYESYSTTVQNLTNLGVLVEDSERALRLRKIIIDKEEATFVEKLPRTVGRLGVRLLRGLNTQQQRAVLRAAAAQQYVLLGGLPGTGKTQTVSVLIQLLAALKLRVLVTAHAHAAVDNVLQRLPASLRVIRLGPAARVAAAVRARSEHELAANCTTTEQLQSLYDSMEVVGVTCLGAAHPMLARSNFDVCIVDEATQVLQSTVVRALCAASRAVLVGDPHQLPPVVRSVAARRLGMEESLFHRLSTAHNTSTLRLQYRMCEPLARLANAVAYGGQLQCANEAVAHATMRIDAQKLPHFSEEEQWLKIACSVDPKDAAVFFDTILPADQNSSEKMLANPYEACVVMALTETLVLGGVATSDIGVIAPYREQVSLLRRCLARGGVEVSTVDQFQGRDKSVIIYSATRRVDDADRKIKEGEVLNDQRRHAVSVTRAKHKFILVGGASALQRYAPLARLIQACNTTTLEKPTIDNLYSKYGHYIT